MGPTAVAFLFLTYYLAIVTSAAVAIGFLFLNRAAIDAVGFVAFFTILAGALVIAGWAVLPPSRRKLLHAALALTLGAALVLSGPVLHRWGRRAFIELRRDELN